MKKIAIFAHYDKHNIVDPYVTYYLEQLQQIADVVFVSDCDLSHDEIEKVLPYSIEVLAKRHGMYDFGSYKIGYLAIKSKIQDYDELILCNDSVYGPLYPLAQIWQKMSSYEVDFWGMTDSYVIRKVQQSTFIKKQKLLEYYIQSYFVVLTRKVYNDDAFINFITSVEKQDSKADVIHKYEVGLTQGLIQEGFRTKAFLKFDSEKFKTGIMQGIWSEDWFWYYEDGFPFIKVALLKENTHSVSEIYKSYKSLPLMIKNNIFDHLNRVEPSFRSKWYFYRQKSFYFISKKLISAHIKQRKVIVWLCLRLLGVQVLKIPIFINFKTLNCKNIKL